MLPKQVPFHAEAALVLALSLVHLILLSMQLYIINDTLIKHQLEAQSMLRSLSREAEQSRSMIEEIYHFANKHEIQVTLKQLNQSPQKITP